MSLPDGFIAHDGGPCPVHEDAKVKVIFADGGKIVWEGGE